MQRLKAEVYTLVLAWTLIGEKGNMANTVATPDRATYIKEKSHTAGKRALAKHYREEFFAEYSAGEMAPEKKALITSILGPDFFAPVDKFESARSGVSRLESAGGGLSAELALPDSPTQRGES
jgi:hypothetical protein